ncbi:MAG TPA: hypothetical protein VJ723_04475 [Candidatus Angelobacter sp.]|nr:hypothetical protein [Candidatus Angelobacter sp.]
MKIRNVVIAGTLLISLLAVNTGLAQDEQRSPLGRQVPCPHPTKLVIKGHNPASVLAGEVPAASLASYTGSVFNQTQINKNFGYTFTFPVCPKECCLWTTAYLTVTFKALQGGPANSSTSANDDVTIYVNGVAVVSQRIWSGAVTTNQTKTTVFAIPGSALSHGHVTLAVEDDTAVVSAVLTLEGCCLCVP